MNCAKPLCQRPALWIPVIKIPTFRTGGMTDVMVPESKPTMLIGEPICAVHVVTYDFNYWFDKSEWEKVRKEAKHRGLDITETPQVTFEPLGWKLDSRYLEVKR